MSELDSAAFVSTCTRAVYFGASSDQSEKTMGYGDRGCICPGLYLPTRVALYGTRPTRPLSVG